MVDRAIVYSAALPQTSDVLNTNKFGMIGLGYALQGILGTTTEVHNLQCTPTVPASLQVVVGNGAIYTLDMTDATAYSDLGTDTHNIVKQGILANPVTLTVTPPSTPGYSQVYLVEAILSDVDTGSAVLPYYNASNPSQPYSGPGNDGMSQYTIRSVQCTIALKAGSPAPTGTQVNPTPDAGYTGLYYITVVNGQVAITGANIVLNTCAPFFPTLPSVPNDVQTNLWTYCVDNGVLNAMAATIYPPVTQLVPGTGVLVRVAFQNTGNVTFNLNGLGAQPVHRANGAQLASGDINPGEILALLWDGAAWQTLNFFGFTSTTTNNNTYTINIPFAVDSGAINAVHGVFSPAITSLAAGLTVEVQIAYTNSGSATLQANGTSPATIRRNNLTLQPRDLRVGVICLFVYDGTYWQLVNARWPYDSFDLSSPPASDMAMAVGDQITITFTNATSLPLHIATVQGLYDLLLYVQVSNSRNTDLRLQANNTSYGAVIFTWEVLNSDMRPTIIPNPPYLNQSPISNNWGTPAGAFLFDLFDGPQGNPADTLNDIGPFYMHMTISTYTIAKTIKYDSALAGGPAAGFMAWQDNTVWTSLGTIDVSQPLSGGAWGTNSTLSGTCVVKRIC